MPILPNVLAEASHPSDNDKSTFPPPLSNAAFAFDSLGVAGFFGGDSSVAGMATTNLIPGRRWGGWYNTPGSYEIAKQYGPLGDLTLCHGLFPDGERDPARLFQLDGREGPPFIAVHSGSNFPHTGQLAQLITSKAEGLNPTRKPFAGRRSTPCPSVTIVNLHHAPEEREHPPLPKNCTAFLSVFPILVSVGGCVLCALVADWFCFASIAVGIIAHGVACFVIGSGKLAFQHHKPAPGAPPGDGVLKGDKALVVLIGEEVAVSAFTRGHFRLQYGRAHDTSERGQGAEETKPGHDDRAPPSDYEHDFERRMGIAEDTIQVGSLPSMETIPADDTPLPAKETPVNNRRHSGEVPIDDGPQPSSSTCCFPSCACQSCWIPPQCFIGYCSILLIVQFFSQLLLIPLGTLFGQLIFIATVVASWLYNTYLSTLDRDKIQADILFGMLHLTDGNIQKYKLSTWTATVAFTSFVLASVHPLNNPQVLLDAMLPNDTVVWRAWKRAMDVKLQNRRHFDQPERVTFEFTKDDLASVDGDLNDSDRKLLFTLFFDAENAWHAWCQVRDSDQMVVLGKKQEVGTKSC